MTARLQVQTPNELEIVLTRAFTAPRRLVFDAFTTPELLCRWYGPPGCALVVCEVDLRVGGAWRYVLRRADGTELRQHGTYREIVAPQRLIRTEANDTCEATAAQDAVVTTDFVEHEGRTTVTSTVRYPSREIRDAMMGAQVTSGVAHSYQRLADVIQELSSTGTAA